MPLASSPLLARLTSLSLASNSSLGDEGLAALFGSPNAANLRDLNLTYTSLSSAGAAILASSPHLSQLRSLNLRNTSVRSSGVKALAASPHLRHLRTLSLDSRLETDAVTALTTTTNLPALVNLSISNRSVKKADRTKLERRFGLRLASSS